MKKINPSLISVLLTNLGGPVNLKEIEPFLFDLFMDRNIIPIPLEGRLRKPIAAFLARKRTRLVKNRYRMIGNGSPLVSITMKQAELLQDRLEKDGLALSVSIGMRYGHPSIIKYLSELDPSDNELIVLPLFPQFCKATTGTTIMQINELVAAQYPHLKVHIIEHFFDHDLYIHAMVDLIIKQNTTLSSVSHNQLKYLFCAHSVPSSYPRKGDPYISQVEKTALLIAKALDLHADQWTIGYQSRLGPLKWVGPTVEQVIDTLSTQDIKHVSVIPLSFISDHLETLYDIDIVLKQYAESRNITLHRIKSLNCSNLFISLLAELVKSKCLDFAKMKN